ncbi:MAG TPA: hypothetical protein VL424_12585 [Pararobbsia sp.]|nr:hypothetical protein [Pararobbsia sp.]
MSDDAAHPKRPRLPQGFETLECFVDRWSSSDQNARSSARRHATRTELRAFYEAALPLMEAALDHVDLFELGKLPPPSHTLFLLLLNVAEIAPHIELYSGDSTVPQSFDERRVIA